MPKPGLSFLFYLFRIIRIVRIVRIVGIVGPDLVVIDTEMLRIVCLVLSSCFLKCSTDASLAFFR